MYKHIQALHRVQQNISPLLERIKQYCAANKETIAVAESVTAGCIQLLLSTAEGATDFFQGGITPYNVGQKAIHLHIDPIYGTQQNCVTEDIAIAMAKHVCTMFRCQIGIAITGYATKVLEQHIDELFAYIAIVRNGNLLLSKRIIPTTEDINAQLEYAVMVIDALAGVLVFGD